MPYHRGMVEIVYWNASRGARAETIARVEEGVVKRQSDTSRSIACSDARGNGRLALFVVSTAAVLAISAAHASAEIIVHLAGPGAGKVASNPPGIECSNIAGEEKESAADCSESYAPAVIELSPTPGSGFVFGGWNGNDVFGFNFGSNSCNAGTAEPCLVVDSSFAMGGAPVEITATFNCAPPVASPVAITGGAGAGGDASLRTLEGAVDPEGCGLEESYFEYGPTTEYGSTTPTLPGAVGIGKGNDPIAVTAETEPLEPKTTYHYRLVAVGPGGLSRGEDRTFTTGEVPVGECPNEAIRHEQGSAALHLPDCMALEMVSPPQKAGSPAHSPNVSADGTRVTFVSQGALGEDPGGLVNGRGATYVASRGGSGWASESTVPGVDFWRLWEFRSDSRPSFTPDFSRWLGFGGTRAQVERGVGQAYEAGLGGFFRLLSKPLVPFFTSDKEPSVTVRSALFQGASADHSHLYFKPGAFATYMSSDPVPAGPGAETTGNVYLARSDSGGEPSLELLQRDRTDKVWGGACGARLGGVGSLTGGGPAPNGERDQGAISVDGSLTYFSARAAQPQNGECQASSQLRILERLETPTGPSIFPLFSSECTRLSLPNPPGACAELSGDDLYQGASLDQSKVYFTTNRQLASSDIDGSAAECSGLLAVAGCDLYLYDRSRPAGERLVQVSAGEELGGGVHERGKEANVYNGVTAISADGSHVYFVAAGVLTDHANPEGATAQTGQPNLYLWDATSEETTFVGTLAPALSLEDKGDAIVFDNTGNGLWGGQGTWRNNAYPVPASGKDDGVDVGGDGHILVFESKAELTPNDGDGRHRDVYRYDAEVPSLECLSCAPGSSASEPDEVSFDVDPRGDETPPGTDFAERRRWVSEDGEVVGFMTAESLVPGDVNGAKDGYLWRQGSLVRLPGKPFAGRAEFDGPFLSHDGATVAFTTVTPLLPRDGDVSADVYVAREDGGFPEPQPARPCEPGVDCQEEEKEPSKSTAGSNSFTGPGNLRHRRCPKGRVRRHGRCLPRHRPHAQRRHHTRQTKVDRKAAK